jgi:hypothetical protein
LNQQIETVLRTHNAGRSWRRGENAGKYFLGEKIAHSTANYVLNASMQITRRRVEHKQTSGTDSAHPHLRREGKI